MRILEVKNLKKIYKTRFGGNQVEALSNISFSIDHGEYVAIMGESGSGKTTLLNMMASLDKPTEGSILLNGTTYADIREDQLSSFRRDHLGFVFQDFNLLDNFNIKDNILLPLVLSGRPRNEMKEKLLPLVQILGIEKLLKKYPYEISGGQKQRAAAARALITSPSLILADEPTGALDSRSSDELLKLFSDINREGQTIVMVTHSVRAAGCASRVLFIKDGSIFSEVSKQSTNEDITPKIFNVLSAMSGGGNSHE
ncbi:putative ABC transport system ATP-binding protein [Paenibacillus rhizosphaerae]|uniref:Putative ABC transport system ATP-binding protein n=1 Tax=Paenibacillus rhizosphaerae TaxID=297318 RepID=A0A839TN50_9BACL|nr:ABC transporter ATP-binding protein [Paenibacillus rhizosphaerae]MBB3128314.1 putative ABC transport system ATP-binding protein [Paenibacillus rhizosphaerae]